MSGLEDLIASIPEEWTSWELRSRRRRTAFVATLARLNAHGGEDFVTGHGDTPAKAIEAAIAKTKEMR